MRLRLIGRISRWQKLRSVFGIFLAIMLTAGAPWVDAAIYYVNPTTGNNANNGLSPGAAWKTIGYALSQANSGDTINAASGNYDTVSGETFPLELESGVALIGAGPGSVTTVNVTNGGSGYATPPDVSFTGGGGIGAEGFAVISGGGVVTEVVVTGGGGGYGSAPAVVITGGGGAGAAATATIGPGTSTISANESNDVFFTDQALSNTTRLSGFLLKHDTSATDEDILEFAVGAFTQSPRIDDNAFVDYPTAGNGDTGIYYHDASASDGAFTPTLENNTMSGLYAGTWLAESETLGAPGDDFSGTIRNNTLSSVDYPFRLSFEANQGGTVAPLFENNSTWRAFNDVYNDAVMGQFFAEFAPVFNNNTFRDASDTSVYSSMNFERGIHTWAPVFTNNTITNPGDDGFEFSLSINSSTGAGNQTLTPVISGNSITDAGDDGISLTLSPIDVPDTATVTFSPTITNNTITSPGDDGIFVSLSVLSNGDFVSNMTVSGNTIANAFSSGIRVSLSEFSDGDDDYTANWVIANNTITNPGAGGEGNGIYIEVSSLSGPATAVHNTTITNNLIDGAASDGLEIEFDPDTTANVDANWMVDGNTITDSDDYGIRVDFSSAAAGDSQSVLIRGNTLTGNYHGIYVSMQTQIGLSSNELEVAENFIDSNDHYGVYVEQIEDSPDPMIFSCNTITNNGDGGVYIDDTGVTTAGSAIAVNFGDSTPASPGHNAIHSNSGGTYNFFNDNALPVKAENNWWGSADAAAIDATISDDNEATGGAVDFEPFLGSAAAINRSITADVGDLTLVEDADTSGGPSVGDTVRFCTTVTGGGNCGSGRGLTMSIPLPPNVTLVPGSVTTDAGVYDTTEPDVTISGIVLEPGEVATVCFDVLVDAGPSVTITVTGSGPDVPDSSDTETFGLGAPAIPADIPTVGEWAMIFLTSLLLLAGLFMMRRRRGTVTFMLAAFVICATPPDAFAAKVKHRAVTIESVVVEENNVTLHLSGGVSYTLKATELRIKDKRVWRERKKVTVLELASMTGEVRTNATAGIPAILKLHYKGTVVRDIELALSASEQQAQSAVQSRDQRKAEARARHPKRQ